MKTLIVCIILHTCVFAQYSENLFRTLTSNNSSFETFTGTADDATNDDFAGLNEDATGDSYVEATATAKYGSYAVKIYYGATGGYPSISNFYALGSRFNSAVAMVRLWTRGNGTGGANLRYRDLTNSVDKVNWNNMVTGTTYTQVDTFITHAANTASVQIYFRAPTTRSQYGLVDSVEWRLRMDTLYIANSGNDMAIGNAANPIKTVAQAMARGFYDGGVFAFKSGDTFAETFTAGSNTTLAVYGGSSPVMINVIDANGYTVTQSALINPATDTQTKWLGWSGKWLGW